MILLFYSLFHLWITFDEFSLENFLVLCSNSVTCDDVAAHYEASIVDAACMCVGGRRGVGRRRGGGNCSLGGVSLSRPVDQIKQEFLILINVCYSSYYSASNLGNTNFS